MIDEKDKMSNYCIILSTTDSQNEADKITNILLESRLVSCVQQIPIKSVYHWQGKIEKSNEILIQMKTKRNLYAEVEKIIKENHSYQVPQIIEIPIASGLFDYLQWIEKETI